MLTVLNAHPHTLLQPFIHSYVLRESRLKQAEMVEPVVARLATILEFQFADPYDVPYYGVDKPNPSSPITVIGPITHRSARIVISGHVEALAVLFQPLGFHTLFAVPLSPLADIGTEGHSLLGASVYRLHERIGNADSFQQRTHLLDAFFLDRLAQRRTHTSVAAALKLLISPNFRGTISGAARAASLSSRQLERLALQYAGMPPRTMLRIARFQKAVRLKVQGCPSWTEVAHASDYHDQTHMIRDFHAFAANSPVRAFEQLQSDHLSILGLQPTGPPGPPP